MKERIDSMKVAIASDHAGFHYKEAIKAHLKTNNIDILDFGTGSDASCDYPDFIRPAALAVSKGDADLGIVLGGSGNGEAITANKVKGIRCAVCWSLETAKLAKTHNNANMISIGERTITKAMALEIVDTWMSAEFEGGRHQRRIEKIEAE
jgi:ribose 5-phosphate isomerase B